VARSPRSAPQTACARAWTGLQCRERMVGHNLIRNQLVGRCDRLLAIAIVVGRDQLDLRAKHAASGVDVGNGEFGALLRSRARPCQGAGQCRREANPDLMPGSLQDWSCRVILRTLRPKPQRGNDLGPQRSGRVLNTPLANAPNPRSALRRPIRAGAADRVMFDQRGACLR
jgi:hypothetical protein